MIKRFIRRILQFLHLDLTKNLTYDRLTLKIMKRVLTTESNCIDVGAHHGELLAEILKLAPKGQHWAFEPLPHLYANLKDRYGLEARVLPFALSNEPGSTTFQHVVDAPAYSGIRKRFYDGKNPGIEEIMVEMETLDNLIPNDTPIAFIKIDVEGAEMQVLSGARDLIRRDQPFILFEFGKGASDYYEVTPFQIHSLMTELSQEIHTLNGWLNGTAPLTLAELEQHFEERTEYYFLSKPIN